jgi:hypothetical protein
MIAQPTLDDGANLGIEGGISRTLVDDALADPAVRIDPDPHPNPRASWPRIEQRRREIPAA